MLQKFWRKNDLSACSTVLIVARCYLNFIFWLDRSRHSFLYRGGFLNCGCRSALQSGKNIFAWEDNLELAFALAGMVNGMRQLWNMPDED